MRCLLALLAMIACLCWARLAVEGGSIRRMPSQDREALSTQRLLESILILKPKVDEEKQTIHVIGGTVFTTRTRIYPLHRHQNGDYFDSRGLDDFGASTMDYDIEVTCEELGQGFRHVIEVRATTEQPITTGLAHHFRRALVRRVALNLTKASIYLHLYEDFKLSLPESLSNREDVE